MGRTRAGTQWSAVTFDDKGGVTGGIVRDAKRTLLQVERTKSGQMVCELNPEDLKLPGVDMAVKPGPKGEIDHIHGDGQPHDHGDDEWIEKAVNGRKLAKAYDECPKWSTLAVHLIVELDREFVNLLTGKNIDGSVIGMAYMDVMCESIPGDAWNGKYEYGISKATQPSLGCNVALVMQELGRNAGSSHYLGGLGSCSHTFPPSAIGQIEDHMDGPVPVRP